SGESCVEIKGCYANSMNPKQEPDADPSHRLTHAILELIGRIPETCEVPVLERDGRARQIANTAAAKAATTAGALALPPGPLGWLTMIPELLAVWRIQGQMVADLAGLYGKTASLSQSQMLYCIFRHGAAMAVRDLVVRVGDRYLVKQATHQALQLAAQKIGIKLTQKGVARGITRWLPFIGAVGVGGYAYYDTAQVAKTAIAMFQKDIEHAPPPPLSTQTIDLPP
ncbi:MAG: hypothetical protein ACOVRB_07890, partial [Akkermansiaceae bacterium]